MLSGINYSHDESSDGNSCNETLTVDADDHALFVRPSFMSGFMNESPDRLSEEGAAEHYWNLLIQVLR